MAAGGVGASTSCGAGLDGDRRGSIAEVGVGAELGGDRCGMAGVAGKCGVLAPSVTGRNGSQLRRPADGSARTHAVDGGLRSILLAGRGSGRRRAAHAEGSERRAAEPGVLWYDTVARRVGSVGSTCRDIR